MLCSLGDALVESIEKQCNALLAGRITTEGRREYYFYGESERPLESAIKFGLAEYADYKYWYGSKRDPKWRHYLDVLYPTEVQMRMIRNEKVLDVLEKHGDKPELPREVRHWAYFKSEPSAQNYGRELQAMGYVLVDEVHRTKDGQFGISFVRTQPVTYQEINRTTEELHHLALQHGGEYDGWECQVTPAEHPGIH